MDTALSERLEALFADAISVSSLPDKDFQYIRLKKDLQQIERDSSFQHGEYEILHKKLVDCLYYWAAVHRNGPLPPIALRGEYEACKFIVSRRVKP